MAPPPINRLLSILALSKVSERELKDLYVLANEIPFTIFLETIQETELELKNSLPVINAELRRNKNSGRVNESLYDEIELLRKRKLKMPVGAFAKNLTSVMKHEGVKSIPAFDSRRGLRVWLKSIDRKVGPNSLYSFVMRMLDGYDSRDDAWRLE